jgi:hypothetical protein
VFLTECFLCGFCAKGDLQRSQRAVNPGPPGIPGKPGDSSVSELEITFWHVTVVTWTAQCALSARQRPVLEIPSIRTLNPFPPFPQSIVSERKCVNCEQSIVFMSSTGQATSSSKVRRWTHVMGWGGRRCTLHHDSDASKSR